MRLHTASVCPVIAFLLVGCGQNKAEMKQGTPDAQATSSQDFPGNPFPVGPSFTDVDRRQVIADLESKLAEDRSTLDELILAKASFDDIRSSLSPKQLLERAEQFRKSDDRYNTASKQLTRDVVDTEALLMLLLIDDERIDHLVIIIRDKYQKNFASKYDVAYVNELLSGRVHKPATALAQEISDHVVDGIRSRYSADHILKSSDDLMNARVRIIVAEIGRSVTP